MKKQILLTAGIFCALLFIPLILAQEAKINIEHIGFGETQREAHFTIHNIGNIPITNVTIFVDGEVYRTVTGGYLPRKGFETILYLDPGTHLIEVRTPEGAYDSLNLTISDIPAKTIPETTQKSVLEENKLILVIITLSVFVVLLWMLLRKPKLKLK